MTELHAFILLVTFLLILSAAEFVRNDDTWRR